MKKPRDDPILPLELQMEILSRLPVKTLMQFVSVCKSWKSLIIHDPSFAKMHLNRSPKNTHILLAIEDEPYEIENRDSWVVPCSVRCLTEDPSSVIDVEGGYHLKGNHLIIGSCNGLICLGNFYDVGPIEEFWVQFWNPATHLMSKKLPTFHLSMRTAVDAPRGKVNLGFGYDNSHDTYKVVVVHWDCTEQKIMTRIYCMNNICCRKILCDPCSPLMLDQIEGKFMSGSVNWLALKNMKGPEYQWDNVTLEQLVIASLDMSTEEYTYMLLPEGVTEVLHFEPNLEILGNHMCLFHDRNRTHFVGWKMNEYGKRKSWTQWMSISYENLQCEGFSFRPRPMFLSEDGNILLLALTEDLEFIKYNIRDNNVEYIPNLPYPNEEFWLEATSYVQSLVSPCQDEEDVQE